MKFKSSVLFLEKFKIKTAGDEGEGEGEGGSADGAGAKEEDDEGDDTGDLSPEEYKKQIKALRAENAKRRLDNKSLNDRLSKFDKVMKALAGDDEEENAEQQLETVGHHYQAAVTRNAILELALENGISGKENLEYFEFLIGKQLNSLEEGEELSEESLEEILSKCSAKSVFPKGNTSTNERSGGNKKPGQGGPDEITQEEFNQMGMMSKSMLYQKNPDLYEKLMRNATMR